jgi:hypothetical protein
MRAIEAISVKGESDEDFDDKMNISEMASEIAPMASSRTGRRRRIKSSTLRFFRRPRISSRRSTPSTCIACGGWNRLYSE